MTDNLKRVAVLILAALMLLPLYACGGPKDTGEAEAVCDIPAVYLGEEPDKDLYTALSERFTDRRDEPDGDVGIVMLYSPHLKKFSSEEIEHIRSLYDRGATIVIEEPTHGELEGFLEVIDHSAVMDTEAQYEAVDVYAFNRQGRHYFLGSLEEPADDEPVDDEGKPLSLEDRYGFALDSVVAWLNENTLTEKNATVSADLKPASSRSVKTMPASADAAAGVSLAAGIVPTSANAGAVADLKQTFDYSSVTMAFPLTVSGTVAHVASSDPDVVTKTPDMASYRGRAADIWLPVGEYDIRLVSGSTQKQAIKSLTRGATSNLYPADFGNVDREVVLQAPIADVPDKPDGADTPDVPGTPDVPDKPGGSGTPGVPDKPGGSGTPDVPDKPGGSGTPDVPGTPGGSGTPDSSGTPDRPYAPERPFPEFPDAP